MLGSPRRSSRVVPAAAPIVDVRRLLLMQLVSPGGVLGLSAYNVLDVVDKLPSLVSILGGGTACDLAPANGNA